MVNLKKRIEKAGLRFLEGIAFTLVASASYSTPTYAQSLNIPNELPPRQKQSSTLDCKMTEENLFRHYLVIEESGNAFYQRIYLDKSDILDQKRCVATYDIEGLEPRVRKTIVHFGKGTYEIQKQGQ